jgi:hypothetical protein
MKQECQPQRFTASFNEYIGPKQIIETFCFRQNSSNSYGRWNTQTDDLHITHPLFA